jgi:hypothetical protein
VSAEECRSASFLSGGEEEEDGSPRGCKEYLLSPHCQSSSDDAEAEEAETTAAIENCALKSDMDPRREAELGVGDDVGGVVVGGGDGEAMVTTMVSWWRKLVALTDWLSERSPRQISRMLRKLDSAIKSQFVSLREMERTNSKKFLHSKHLL